MMPVLLAFSRVVDRLNEWMHRWVKWLLLAAILLSAGNALTRKVSLTSNAALELQWYLFSAVFLICAGYTLQRGEHVKIDIFYGRLSRRTQVTVDIIGTVLFLLPFCLVTIVLVWPDVVDRFVSGEGSSNAGGLLQWPAWALIPIGFSLLFLQGVSELIKRAALLAGAGPDAAPAHTGEDHQAGQ
jgi:TRAP-type mannitol/chloroaromatic compound transport system permease small subunit